MGTFYIERDGTRVEGKADSTQRGYIITPQRSKQRGYRGGKARNNPTFVPGTVLAYKV